MAKETKEQEIKELLREYFETWEQLLHYEELLDGANNRWLAAKSRLFEKRSREHCEAVLNFLRRRIAESGEENYSALAQDLNFWLEADSSRKKLKYV